MRCALQRGANRLLRLPLVLETPVSPADLTTRTSPQLRPLVLLATFPPAASTTYGSVDLWHGKLTILWVRLERTSSLAKRMLAYADVLERVSDEADHALATTSMLCSVEIMRRKIYHKVPAAW